MLLIILCVLYHPTKGFKTKTKYGWRLNYGHQHANQTLVLYYTLLHANSKLFYNY